MTKIIDIIFDETTINLVLTDGRTITTPLDCFPRLAKATKKQLNNWQILGDSEGVHWPDIDEDLSVKGFSNRIH